MRVQYRDERHYEKRRAVALGTGSDCSFDLINSAGRVIASFEQVSYWEPTMDAYIDAQHPPKDDCMERFEDKLRENNRRLQQAAQERRERKAKQRARFKPRWRPRPERPIAAFTSSPPPFRPKGPKLEVDYKPKERPRGTYVEF